MSLILKKKDGSDWLFFLLVLLHQLRSAIGVSKEPETYVHHYYVHLVTGDAVVGIGGR